MQGLLDYIVELIVREDEVHLSCLYLPLVSS
jgi:hypothetical protein